MTTLVRFEIPGYGSFTVSKDWAESIAMITEQAAQATLMVYPGADMVVPLYLVDCGSRRIAVIKEYRSATGKTLRDSKRDIDRVFQNGERLLVGNYPFNQAEAVAAAFRSAGATVHMPSALEMLARAGT